MSVENALEAIQVALKDLKRGGIGGDGGGDGGGGFNPVLNQATLKRSGRLNPIDEDDDGLGWFASCKKDFAVGGCHTTTWSGASKDCTKTPSKWIYWIPIVNFFYFTFFQRSGIDNVNMITVD
eukprot:gene26982-33868_t